MWWRECLCQTGGNRWHRNLDRFHFTIAKNFTLLSPKFSLGYCQNFQFHFSIAKSLHIPSPVSLHSISDSEAFGFQENSGKFQSLNLGKLASAGRQNQATSKSVKTRRALNLILSVYLKPNSPFLLAVASSMLLIKMKKPGGNILQDVVDSFNLCSNVAKDVV